MSNASPTKLPRVLGPWMATAIVIGTVIGSGVFKKPYAVAKDMAAVADGVVVEQAPFGMIVIAWVLIGVFSFVGSLILAEIAVIYPHAGGNYVYLREGYGRWAGFLWGWVEFWIIRAGSIAALATVFAETFHDILRYFLSQAGTRAEVLSPWALTGVTVTIIAILALVNARGTVLGGGLQVVVTSVKVATLVGIALLPFICMATQAQPDISSARLAPLWPASWGTFDWVKFGSALVAILWAYDGWMNLAPMGEEVKEPNRNIPLAFLMGSLAIIVLYVSANIAYHFVVPREQMIEDGKDSPVATLFTIRLLGEGWAVLISLAIMISVFGALNGNLLIGPRLLFAMGRDGLAPRALCQLHANWGTPALALAVQAGWAILLVIGGEILRSPQLGYLKLDKPLFDILTDYVIFGVLVFQTMSIATIFICRRQYPVDRVALPYRSWGYPWLPIFYIVGMAAVVVSMFIEKPEESLIAVGFIAVGGIAYLAIFWGRPAPVAVEPNPTAIEAGEPPVRPRETNVME
jgi:amino acid transporter